MTAKVMKANDSQLKRDINLIYKAVEQSEPSRLLRRWQEKPEEVVLKAMRRAIFETDGTLQVTTDALVEAFGAGLRALNRRKRT